MRMSELSQTSGVAIPTIKYYLREGMLPQGVQLAATRAEYDESHLRRLRLRLNAGAESAGLHAVIVAHGVEPDGPGIIAERAFRVALGAPPGLVGEQLVVHLPETALLVRARGEQGECEEAHVHSGTPPTSTDVTQHGQQAATRLGSKYASSDRDRPRRQSDS